MGDLSNPKVIGATVIGFALVAGAYVTSNFGEPSETYQQPAAIVASEETPARVSIAVADEDGNGIEDWQDSFATNEIILPSRNTDTPYTAPDTVTGQTAIKLVEDMIGSRIHGPFGPTDDEVVTNSVDALDKISEVKLFGASDLDVMEEWEDEDVLNYANTLASVIIRNSVPGLDHEVTILEDIVSNNNKERMEELEIIRDVYMGYRDETALIPVPKTLTKPHLDLLNTYQAIYEDINGMTKFFEDPLLSLVYIKRYLRDTEALNLALENMYLALAEYNELYSDDDPALLFIIFSPDYQP